MVFYSSMSDNKFPQISRTLLNILADINNAVFWMVSTGPVIPKPSCPCISPLVTVPRASITIGINVTFMFHRFFFFQFLSKVQVLIPSLLCGPLGLKSSQSCKFSFFVDYYYVCLAIRLYLKSLCVSGQILGCLYAICSDAQSSISGIIPSGSPRSPSLT